MGRDDDDDDDGTCRQGVRISSEGHFLMKLSESIAKVINGKKCRIRRGFSECTERRSLSPSPRSLLN